MQVIYRGSSRAHLDLRCPFDLPAEFKSNVVSFTRADRDQRVQARVFDSSTTEVESSVLKHITVPEEKTPAKSPRRSPVAKATDEDLTRSFHHYMESLSPSSGPKKIK